MINRHSVEFTLLPTVKQFAADYYPDGVVIFHPSVYFPDATFRCEPLDESEARRELGTSPQTKNICEITPDYGIFRKEDVVGIRMRVGQTNGEELSISPCSPQFDTLTSAAAPIPYVVWQSAIQSIPKGKKMVVVVKDGAYPIAVVDHKGKGDINSQAQRRKVAYQARRFCARDIFMITDNKTSSLVRESHPITASVVKGYELGTVWRLTDHRTLVQPAAPPYSEPAARAPQR